MFIPKTEEIGVSRRWSSKSKEKAQILYATKKYFENQSYLGQGDYRPITSKTEQGLFISFPPRNF